MSLSDSELLERYRTSGQTHLLNELLSRHLSGLRRTVFQMVLNHSTADDLTQDVFLRVIRGIDRFEGRSSFSTWLYTITMNTVRSHLKKKQTTTRRERGTEIPQATSMSSDPQAVAQASDLATEIEGALETLSPAIRAAVVLVCLQDKSAEEAAAIEDCTTKTMHWRVHEGRRRLKTCLAEYLS